MVENQLRRRGITDERVLSAMAKIPRHRFLPDPNERVAYNDCPLPIGYGQTISQPYMVAVMSQALCLTGDERVLEIGSGSGYQAAVLAELSREVYSIERFPSLAARARSILTDLGYTNITIIVADGSLGHPEAAPYDRIIVTAAAPLISENWIEQLVADGILLAPIGDRWGQTLTKVVKRAEKLEYHNLGGCVFVPLVGARGWDN